MGKAKKISTVFLRWNGKDTIMARLFPGGVKVTFKKGVIKEAEYKKAHGLAGRFKQFEIVAGTDLTEKEFKAIKADQSSTAKEEAELDADEAASAKAQAAKAKKPVEPPAKTTFHVVTAQDLENNPDLLTKGVNVGDEIELPEEEKSPKDGDNSKSVARRKAATKKEADADQGDGE